MPDFQFQGLDYFDLTNLLTSDFHISFMFNNSPLLKWTYHFHQPSKTNHFADVIAFLRMFRSLE